MPLLDACREAVARNPELAASLVQIAAKELSLSDSATATALASLSDELTVALVRARSSVNESLVYAHHVFAEINALLTKFAHPPQSLLEIGPGANLGALFCFGAAGVPRLAGADIAVAGPPRAGFYRELRDFLSCVGGYGWWRQFAGGSYPHVTFPINADDLDPAEVLARIDYRAPVSSAALPFHKGEFEAVYSVAALEHVEDPAATVAELARVTLAGGLSIHEIDLKHHGSSDPLSFLRWTDEEWLAKARPYGEERSLERILDGSWSGEVFCNRVRKSGWVELFRTNGFAPLLVEDLVVFDTAAIDRDSFAEPFRSKQLDDLAVLGFRIVARRMEDSSRGRR